MQTAGFEPARARARSRVLTNRPTRRRGRVTRTELGVYIVHNNVKQDGLRFLTLVRQRPDEAWRWGTRSVPKFHSESSLRAAIHTQVSVTLDVCTYLTICWAESAQIHRGGPVKTFGKVSCRSQIERRTSHSSGTKEDPDFQRSHKLNWTPNRNRGWVEACAHAR